MMKRNKNVFKSWFFVAFWMLFIFLLSAQPASESNGLSKNVTKIIIDTIGKVIPFDIEISTANDLLSQLNHIVRKSAHFCAYLILGILVVNAFSKSGIKGFKAFVFSLLFCILYAMSDEFHQLYVPGRGGRAADVFIDSAGGLCGILIFISIKFIRVKELKHR